MARSDIFKLPKQWSLLAELPDELVVAPAFFNEDWRKAKAGQLFSAKVFSLGLLPSSLFLSLRLAKLATSLTKIISRMRTVNFAP